MRGFIVEDLMTREVKTLGRNDALSIADELMSRENVRHAPVLDDDGLLCGVVSQRDLFRGALAKALGYGDVAQRKLLSILAVKEVMTTEVVTASPAQPLSEAARSMLERRIGCLPVVDQRGKVVGILSESDFLKLAVDDRLP